MSVNHKMASLHRLNTHGIFKVGGIQVKSFDALGNISRMWVSERMFSHHYKASSVPTRHVSYVGSKDIYSTCRIFGFSFFSG